MGLEEVARRAEMLDADRKNQKMAEKEIRDTLERLWNRKGMYQLSRCLQWYDLAC